MLWPAGACCMDGQASRLVSIRPRQACGTMHWPVSGAALLLCPGCHRSSISLRTGTDGVRLFGLHAAGATVSVQVLMLVPTAPRGVLPIIADHLPNKAQPRGLHCLYLRAVLQLAQSKAADSLRNGLQSALVGHLLDLDVEIKWQDIADQAAGQLPLMPVASSCCSALEACLCRITARGRREYESSIQRRP